MKNVFRIVGMALVLLLYVYTAKTIVGHSSFERKTIEQNAPLSLSTAAQSVSFAFIVPPPQNQSSVESTNLVPTPVRTTHHHHLFESSKKLDLKQLASVYRFIYFSKNTIVQFRKTDIVFPFHYFL